LNDLELRNGRNGRYFALTEFGIL